MRTIHYAVLKEIYNQPSSPRTVLDVGCGDGSFTRELAAVLPKAEISAVDTAVSKPFSSGNISFFKGGVEALPFASESFDLVYTALSLHHWSDKEKGIREIFRVLKSGGRLVIGDPLLEDWLRNRFLGWLMQAIDRGSFTNEERLRGYLSSAGFEETEIRLVPNTMKSLYLITARKP